MTDFEERLRGLRELAAPAGGTVDSLRGRARRRRARRSAGVSLLALAVAFGGFQLWSGDDDGAQVDVVDDDAPPFPSSTSTTARSTTSAPTPSTTARGALVLPKSSQPLDPGQLVISRFVDGAGDPGTNELSVISAVDGSIMRTLDVVDTSEGGILDVAISTDRRTILATRGTSACTGELVAYAADGTGDPVVYPHFQNPLLVDRSPDGSTIAVSGDDDCDGLQTLTVWPIVEGTGPGVVFGDGGVAAAGLVSDGEERRAGPGGPDDRTVVGISYRDARTLDVVVEPSGAHRIDLDRRAEAPLPLDDAAYLGFTSADGGVRLALVQVDTGPELGVETAIGIEQTIALDERPIDIASIGSEPVWVTPQRQLFRILEVNTVQLRDDVTAVAS